MQHTYIALDLETTGLSATKDRILEIGAVMVENGEVTGTYETFVDNGVEIPERIRELTGITEDMVAGSPEMKPAVEGFLAFSGEKPLLGHNILFDYGFMKRNVQKIGGSYERELAILIHSESALSGYFLMSYECQVQTPYLASKNGVLTFSL